MLTPAYFKEPLSHPRFFIADFEEIDKMVISNKKEAKSNDELLNNQKGSPQQHIRFNQAFFDYSKP